MNFTELVKKRRSVRKYNGQPLKPEEVETILRAALHSPASKSSNCWEFIVVEKKETLAQLALCKTVGAKFVTDAALAIVVVGDSLKSDVWIEDTSVAMILMQLQAEDLGLGSCWVQLRQRETESGVASTDFVRGLLNIPLQMEPLAFIALGQKLEDKPARDDSKLQWEKVHIGKF